MVYNFLQLSYLDFEDLSVDLLQAETGERYEVFKPGKDGGIDARNVKAGIKTILQCKHFARSGIESLLATLKNTELDKVQKLKPDRYILFTSVPLSPGNKDAIKNLFSPYILSSRDIYGQDDINNLLDLHPDIETRNFKLWISSSAV